MVWTAARQPRAAHPSVLTLGALILGDCAGTSGQAMLFAALVVLLLLLAAYLSEITTQALAEMLADVVFVGRRARYQYLNMDPVVAQALSSFNRLELPDRRFRRTAA